MRIGGGGGPATASGAGSTTCGLRRDARTATRSPSLAVPETSPTIAAIAPGEAHAGPGREAAAATSSRRGRPEPIRAAYARLGRAAPSSADELVERIPTTMVMEEMPTPRETHVLLRGQYDKPGEKVVARRARGRCPPLARRAQAPTGSAWRAGSSTATTR